MKGRRKAPALHYFSVNLANPKHMWQDFNIFSQINPPDNKALALQRSIFFLREKFWIADQLINSDETGADCTIQRKVTLRNLMDKSPARFGIVKSLYYSSADMLHAISPEYIIDEDFKPRNDFFLLAHTGTDDSPKMYFLTAKTILEKFVISPANGADKFTLPGTLVLNDKYLVSSRENTLAKMEYELAETDFVKNRSIFSKRVSDDWATVFPDPRNFKGQLVTQIAMLWKSYKANYSQDEARHKGMSQHFTKSLLKNRFWVPEQALVFNQAIYDFIIQRKVTPQNMLDNTPPIFGLVKTWFFESETSTYYIPKTSIVDEENKPRKDFFFIAYSESNYSRRTYFLPAKLIAENFDVEFINGAEKYCIPGSALINSDKYLVTSTDNMLAKMEYLLSEADFLKNRSLFAATLHSNN